MSTALPRIILKPGRENTMQRRHPWIFSGAINQADRVEANGSTVDIFSADGRWLARGAWSAHSQIRVRIWSFDQEEQVDPAFFQRRIDRCIEARKKIAEDGSTTAYRLVNAESDGLPGVVVDRYGGILVCQIFAAGAELWKTGIIEALRSRFPDALLFERSDGDSRSKEGLSACVGAVGGDEVPALVEVKENGHRFMVNVHTGHKTGFYLDQRENRKILGRSVAGARVLNCFCYTGGFTVYAHGGGASQLVQVDSSADALHLAEENLRLNGCDTANVDSIEGDVFDVLRQLRSAEERFDCIILDPPKFASSAAQVQRAARGYKDINMLAMQLLRPGGQLFTFSCSGHITTDLFQKIVAGAALDAAKEVRIQQQLAQASDHPVLLSFPESLYLKGLSCSVE